MTTNSKREIIEQLLAYISENKQEKMHSVLQSRTRHVSVVLEDIFQPHNASAVLRTCDIFGIQDVHVIEQQYSFKPIDGITMGSAQWVDVHKYKTTEQTFSHLKAAGYTVVATSPHGNSYQLPQLPLDAKIALVFGSERTGLSSYALENADTFVKIPMYGFAESFNVSVSVALCLYDIVNRLHASPYEWQLSDTEKEELLLEWIKKTSKTAAILALKK